MKKKFVLILTAIMLCLAFALSACGGTGGGNSSGENGKERMWKTMRQEITVNCSYTEPNGSVI